MESESPPETGAFHPVARTPLSLLVARQIRDAIVAGELAVGTQIPSEKELTARFDVSRSTIREALRIVQALGLLSGGDTVSTSRPRVSVDHTVARASEALENALRLGQVPLHDIIELRLALEGGALSAEVVDTERLTAAKAALDVMRRPDVDVATFHAADVQFHICLAGVGGNAAFPLVMGVLRDAIAGHLLDALDAMDDARPVLSRLAAEHGAIVDAIEAGDGPLAAKLVRAHVWDFYTRDVATAGRDRQDDADADG